MGAIYHFLLPKRKRKCEKITLRKWMILKLILSQIFSIFSPFSEHRLHISHYSLPQTNRKWEKGIHQKWMIIRVRNGGVRVGENLLISLFHSAWTGEGERKNNSKFTDPNPPISDSDNETQFGFSTDMRFNLCTWLGEISSCPCLTVLPCPAWVLLNKICKDQVSSM